MQVKIILASSVMVMNMRLRIFGRSLYFDPAYLAKKSYLIQGRIVTNIGKNAEYAWFIGKNHFHSEGQFSIKIRKSRKRWVGIGIIDSGYRKLKQFDLSNPNMIFYHGYLKRI